MGYINLPMTGAPIFPSLSDFPVSAADGAQAVAADTGSLYIYDSTNGWELVASPGGGSLPSQSGNEGKFLTTDGTSAIWSTTVNAYNQSLSFQVKGAASDYLIFTDPNFNLVGINNSAPASALHVIGSSTDVTEPIVIVESSGNQVPLTFRTGGTDRAYVKSDSSGYLAFGAMNGAVWETGGFGFLYERMLITSTGLVGIGTSSPTEKLEVVGNIRTNSGDVIVNNAGYGLKIKQGSNAKIGVTGAFPGGGTNTVTVSTTAVTSNSIIFISAVSGATTIDPKVWVSTITAGTSFVISSGDNSFTGTVGWMIVERIP